MPEIIKPGTGVLFMKVGTHAQEDLKAIIERKSREIKVAGFAMWGYGGNTCHPTTMVQPFAHEVEEHKKPIYLCMQAMQSNHWAEPLEAKQYSTDGRSWQPVPDGIHVLGSRFALIIKDLRRERHSLELAQTRVAIGPNRGKLGTRYVSGRVDKACLEVMGEPERINDPDAKKTTIDIDVVAELVSPYAVFVKN